MAEPVVSGSQTASSQMASDQASRPHYLIVRANLRARLLEKAAEQRTLSTGEPRFTRVRESYLNTLIDRYERWITRELEAEVRRQGRCGRTLR